jgi:hypothetical protein
MKFYKLWIKSNTEAADFDMTVEASEKARALELFKAMPALREWSIKELEGCVSEIEG